MTTAEPFVLRDDADGVATITLNRPDKLNALNATLFGQLREHVDALSDEIDTVGCVVLTGAGRAFCAGNDLAAIAAREQAPTPHFQAETIDRIAAWMAAMPVARAKPDSAPSSSATAAARAATVGLSTRL